MYVHAEQPWRFGVEAGVANMSTTGTIKGKMSMKGISADITASPKFFNPKTFIGGIWGAYAFHENFGVGLNMNVLIGNLSSRELSATIAGINSTIEGVVDISSSRLHIGILPLIVYPFGSQDEEAGVFDLHLGGNVAIPLSDAKLKTEITSLGGVNQIPTLPDQEIKKDELTAVGVGLLGGVGYQIPGGVTLSLDYMYEFTEVEKRKEAATDENKQNFWGLYLKGGYNFATLFDEGSTKSNGIRRGRR